MSKGLITLRAALNLARSRKLFHGTPADVMPALNVSYVPRERCLTGPELNQLCSEPEPHRALWVAAAVFTGGRASEVSKLDWSDVKWTTPATVQIRGIKTSGAKRLITLADG